MDEKVFRGVSLAMVQEQAKTIRYLPEDFCCINVPVVGCGLEGVRCSESTFQEQVKTISVECTIC
jgi:hypothetical protein